MSRVSDELLHKALHAHFDQEAKSHAGHAAAHAAMMEHHGEGTAEHAHHKEKHSLHKEQHENNAATTAYHHDQMKKAASDEMHKTMDVPASLENAIRKVLLETFGNTLVPSAVSAVAPGITMVPRAGERPVPATPNVPLEFAKLVAVDEDQEGLRQ